MFDEVILKLFGRGFDPRHLHTCQLKVGGCQKHLKLAEGVLGFDRQQLGITENKSAITGKTIQMFDYEAKVAA
ncbi:hypothetical protein [Sunxiuqinia indica]|uniref:hypothetical protein n=1 Tax=Sunxiuqinia indica TaxID=2692584 RepID=UPI001358A847|nr:hypothetical protein [Sunxiuqinia indica]